MRVNATIVVEREGHKGIVIGKGGSMLKQIGSNARTEIAALLDSKVFLDLRVKARPDWRKDELQVQRLGYRKEK